jgi:molybdate transport system substrate-binding protein
MSSTAPLTQARHRWRAAPWRIALLPVVLAAVGLAGPAGAAEIRLLAAGATESTVRAVVGTFEKESGHTVLVTFGAVGELRDRIEGGTPADATIVTPAIIEQLARRQLVRAGSRLDLGRVGGGIAVCAGAPRPVIDTPEALRAALLQAREVHYADPARATAGAHFMKVVERLGIADAVRAKGRAAPGGKAAMEAMARACDGAIGLTQVSEILSVPQVSLVGPYPAGLQSTTVYAGVLLSGASQVDGARALLRFLMSPEVQARFARAGFEPAP